MAVRYHENVDIRMEIKVPPLTVSGIPEGTKSLTLIMDDPDAMGAVGKVWVHWVAWNIDPTNYRIRKLDNRGDDRFWRSRIWWTSTT